MDWFAGLHFWIYILILLSPFFLPKSWHFYIYLYLIILLLTWLLLDRCPLFFARETKQDDTVIHLGELGIIDPLNPEEEQLVRLLAGLAPLMVIILLGYYPTFTLIFAIINLLIFYRRYQWALISSD